VYSFQDERQCRIAQFSQYLTVMQERQRQIKKGNSFIIFEEQRDRDSSSGKQLAESKKLTRPLVVHLARRDDGGGSITLGADLVMDQPDDSWRNDNSPSRFIQFSFNSRYFDIDIPNTILYQTEAEQILRCRSGFFYVKECRQFEHPKERVHAFNPVRKIYLYAEERTAAEDMAFVLFDVWKFPVDWRFYVTAKAFKERTKWEVGVLIE